MLLLRFELKVKRRSEKLEFYLGWRNEKQNFFFQGLKCKRLQGVGTEKLLSSGLDWILFIRRPESSFTSSFFTSDIFSFIFFFLSSLSPSSFLRSMAPTSVNGCSGFQLMNQLSGQFMSVSTYKKVATQLVCRASLELWKWTRGVHF